MVKIDNYDLRVESYFESGDNISISGFYKSFHNHIELVNSGGYTWQNVDKSNVIGVELEGKKVLSSHFEVGANLTLVKSKTEFVRNYMEIDGGIRRYIPVDTISRPMFGQSPFVINVLTSYKNEKLGILVSLCYNLQGERLVVASSKKEVPDIYEQPRHLVDFKVNKNLGKHFAVSMQIKDLLNTSIIRSYDYSDWQVDYDNYQFGTTYILSLTYKLSNL